MGPVLPAINKSAPPSGRICPVICPIAELVAEHADGSAVSNADLGKALAKPTPVVLGYNGVKINAEYLSLFKPDTLVLFLPKPATTVAPAPGAPVMPTCTAFPVAPSSAWVSAAAAWR